MKWVKVISAIAFVTAINTDAAAAYGFTPTFSGPVSPAIDTADESASSGTLYLGSGKPYRTRSARRRIKIGGLMLGIGWAVPAMVGLAVMDLADDAAVGARMLIPYYGLSEAGVIIADNTLFFAVPCFFPSIVQVVGTCLLFSGLTSKGPRRFSAAPVLYKEGGGGVGMSFAM